MSGQGVIEAENRWARAILQQDERVLKLLMHPTFVFVGVKTAGLAAWTRQDWLAAVSGITFEALEHKVRDLQVFGGVAIATIDGYWRGTVNGATVEERFLMTDVWSRAMNSPWLVVRRHSSRYVEGADGALEDAPHLMLNTSTGAAKPPAQSAAPAAVQAALLAPAAAPAPAARTEVREKDDVFL